MLQKAAHFIIQRPLVLFLLLQVVLAIVLDRCGQCGQGGQIAFCSLLTLLFGIVAAHILQRRFVQGCVLVGLVIFSASLFFFQQKNLSNIFPKQARYEGVVKSIDSQTTERSRFIVDLRQRVYPSAEAVSGRTLLTVAGSCDLARGARIQFKAGVKEPTSYRNPGVFDYAKYLERKNIWGRAFVEECALVQTVGTGDLSLRDRIRGRILSPLTKEGNQYGPVMAALILGSKTIERDDQDTIRMAGLSHLFAISGSQFAVMSAVFYFMIAAITRCFVRIYLLIPRQKIAAAITLLFVLFYLWIVDPQPSIIRAGIMISCFLVAVLLEQQRKTIHFIVLSACVVLFLRPMDLFDIAFELSYLCVLVLVIVYPRIAKFFRDRIFHARYPRPIVYVAHLVCITWLLNILLIPLVLYSFKTSPVSGLINNLWAVPLFDLLVVPLSLIYLLFVLVAPAIAAPLVFVWDHLLDLFFFILHLVETWHLPRIDIPTPHLIHIAIFYIGLLIFSYTRRRLIGFVSAGLLVLSLSLTWVSLKHWDDLRITQIDVGQGDAILIEADHKNILIDTGGHKFIDIGEIVLVPFLKYKWITRIDLLIITHADLDHYGGAKTLVDSIDVGEAWITRQSLLDDSNLYQELLVMLKKKGVAVHDVTAGEERQLSEHVMLDVLWPNKESMGTEDNDASLVIQLKHDDIKALFLADVPDRIEKKIVVQYGPMLVSDLIKIAHHGAKATTTNEILQTVHPRFATIGVVQNSRFGHPHRNVLDRLQRYNVKVLRTDLMGATGVRVRHGETRTFALVEGME